MLKRTISFVDVYQPSSSKVAKSDLSADAATCSRPRPPLKRTPTLEDIPLATPPRRSLPPASPRRPSTPQAQASVQQNVASSSTPQRPLKRTKGLMEAVLETPRRSVAPSRTQTLPDIPVSNVKSKTVPLKRFATRPVLAPVTHTHTPRRARIYTSSLASDNGQRRVRTLSVFVPAPGTKLHRVNGAYWYQRALKVSFGEKRKIYWMLRDRGARIV
ncbi:hypothetical protein EXIGLDRAFT_94758 [Exidia glandulosa HHB12029]|uniref:Uncharacterized protein n=1 Tax=Exidia glandulosa HHB12029 TaxID=1314781 RepID=A0A165H6U5_EXIGL|nr:hypothetical protein EXIGLDRAFT_94758 [Exidia glandulosa HHB12029]